MLHHNPQDEPVIFQGELAVAAQLFGDIADALDAIAMAFAGGHRDAVPEQGLFRKSVFDAQKNLTAAVFQHQADAPLVGGQIVLGISGIVQGIGQDGGKENLIHGQICQFNGCVKADPLFLALGGIVRQYIIQRIISAVALYGGGLCPVGKTCDQLPGGFFIGLLNT